MAQQTAVEFLLEKLYTEYRFAFSGTIVDQAKEIEKQQIIKAYHKGLFGNMELKSTTFADKYYKDTYV